MKENYKKLSPVTEATYYILLALNSPLHGYGIIKEVESQTNGRLVLVAGTLYGVIQNLLKYKLIYLYSEEEPKKKKKLYMLTEEGTKLLKYEVERLEEMVKNGKKVKL